ncbi:hypothetical protein ECC02_011676 [Trypanosoma cruzi]|uniref:Uncharacterized protein n=1 Tax=Trypanosoma cruzi TaxID=5693 RepID=A0A7J6XN06_TRYCR|nr:hypothetical protein ECC02_011676 [Trypanosoma cruzi]
MIPAHHVDCCSTGSAANNSVCVLPASRRQIVAIDGFIPSVAVTPDSSPFIAVEMKICGWTPTHQSAPSLLFIGAWKGMCVWWCLVHIFFWVHIPLQAEGGVTLRRGALPSHAAHCDSSCITLFHIFRSATPLILLQPLWFSVFHAFDCATIHPLVWPPHPNSGAQHRERQSTSLHVPTQWCLTVSQASDNRRVLCWQYNTRSCSK